MNHISPPTVHLEALRQTLRDLNSMPRRVQVRAVMPLVDALIQQGFSIAYVTQVLNSGGVPFKPTSLKQAVYLWRKKNGTTSLENTSDTPVVSVIHHRANQAAPVSALPTLTKTITPLANPSQSPERPQLTKARLQEIREGHIDLDALIREGRKVGSPE